METNDAGDAAGGWRAKLYQLNDRGDWDDRGTGMVQCVYSESLRGPVVAVIAEVTGIVLLESQVSADSVYQRQGDTIVTWNDCTFGLDLALSFEDVDGCAQIFASIQSLHDAVGSSDERSGAESASGGGAAAVAAAAEEKGTGADVRADRDEAARREQQMEDDAALEMMWGSSVSAGGESGAFATAARLPQLERANLAAIAVALEVEPAARVRMAVEILNRGGDFFERLLSIFDDAEDLEDAAALGEFYSIVKRIALLNHGGLYDILLSDRFFTRLVGVLEHDPDVPLARRAKHRAFVETRATFKEVVPIRNPLVLAKIHQNFRIQYLKDCVLLKVLDDAGNQSLKILLKENNQMIVSEIASDPEYLSDVFGVIYRGVQTEFDVRREMQEAIIETEGTQEDTEHASMSGGSAPASQLNTSDVSADASPSTATVDVSSEMRRRSCAAADAVDLLQQLCSLAREADQETKCSFFHSLCVSTSCTQGGFFDLLTQALNCIRNMIYRWDADAEKKPHLVAAKKMRLGIVNLLNYSMLQDHKLLIRYVADDARAASERPPADWGDSGSGEASASASTPPLPSRTIAAGAAMWACRSASGGGSAVVAAGPAAAGAGAGAAAKEKGGEASSMLKVLIWCITEVEDAGVQSQVAQLMRNLLDPDLMEESQKRDVLENFYNHGIKQLLGPLEDQMELPVDRRDGRDVHSAVKGACNHACELLSFCVQMHGFRIKYYVLKNDVIAKVLTLAHFREKHLVLTAIRFVRTCLGLKDPFYNRYIVKNRLMDSVFVAFRKNGARNNLINSVVIELCEWIRAEKIKILVDHIVENFSDTFDTVSYVNTFKLLSITHQQIASEEGGGGGGGGGGAGAQPNESGGRGLDAREEDYFEGGADDEQEQESAKDDSMHQLGDEAEPSSVALLAKYDDAESDEDDPAKYEGGVPYTGSLSDDAGAAAAAVAAASSSSSAESSPSSSPPPPGTASVSASASAAASAAASDATDAPRSAKHARSPGTPGSPELQAPKRARIDDEVVDLRVAAKMKLPSKGRHRGRGGAKGSIVIKLGGSSASASGSSMGDEEKPGTTDSAAAMSKEGSSGSDEADDDSVKEPNAKRARVEVDAAAAGGIVRGGGRSEKKEVGGGDSTERLQDKEGGDG